MAAIHRTSRRALEPHSNLPSLEASAGWRFEMLPIPLIMPYVYLRTATASSNTYAPRPVNLAS